MAEKEQLDRTANEFIWNIIEIHSRIEEIHKNWAEILRVTEPQWLILMAIDELDQGRGSAASSRAREPILHRTTIWRCQAHSA
ncbi:hypothetical protein GGD65_006282 [Bradyrhizobium sp. CIR18]|uniref:hypothetical protein n=1 Tax=Bradyrhizobium sp. CIR18 TaxID=2663839 RepID=UPI001606024E|nr:hypothetical protein [Bradyrhizobium sp. CIR18]MBB4365216.1 hypothetical protein [Bradyrhizobium sp. CIR18]